MSRFQSHHQAPTLTTARLVLVYRNRVGDKCISHVGLGVSARNTAAVLRRRGIRVDVWPLSKAEELGQRLVQTQMHATLTGEHPVTHVVIQAPWMPTKVLQQVTMAYPEVVFALVCHSNVGFLQVDPGGVQLLRESFDMAVGCINFRAGGNCAAYSNWVRQAYGVPCSFLPNLYDLSGATDHPHRRPGQSGVLRLGCFGAPRPLKNTITAVAAALEACKRLNRDTEVWISGGRPDGGDRAITAAKAIAAGVPRFALREQHWQSWAQFRQTVASMDLLMQPSFTESFNMCSADGIAEGIASVTSTAIEWVPTNWQADSDNAGDIADTAIALLHDPMAPRAGLEALKRYIEVGVPLWMEFLLQRS